MTEEGEVAEVHYSRKEAAVMVALGRRQKQPHASAYETIVALYDLLADRDATIDSLKAEVERLRSHVSTVLAGKVEVVAERDSLRAELEEARRLLRAADPRRNYIDKWELSRRIDAFLSKSAPEPQDEEEQ